MATYAITIAGVSKSLQPGWSISESANCRAVLSAAIVSATAAYRPAIGDEVVITEDGTTIFGGYISEPAEQGLGGEGITGIVTSFTAADYNSLAERRTVIDGGFPAGYTMAQCITSLCGYLTDYGVSVDAAQATGSSLTAPVGYDIKSVIAFLDDLALIFSGISGTSHLWRIGYDKKLRMFAVGDLTAPVSITTANRNAIGDVSPAKSRGAYANYVTLLAGTGTGEVTDTFAGDGSTAAFALTYPLYSNRGYVTNGANNEPIGVTTPPYWTYDSATNTITRTSAPANLNAISITYIAQYPVRVTADGGAAAADRVDTVFTAPDTFNAIVASKIAIGLLARAMAAQTQTVKYRTLQVGLHPGQTQTITVAGRSISGTFLITDVQIVNTAGNVVFRDVTAVSGTTYPGSWRDAESTGSSSGATVGGTVTITSGGGVSGSGTSGTLAQWTATSTLGDATAVPAALLTGTIAAGRLPQFTGGDITSPSSGSIVLNIGAGVIVDADVNASAAIGWTKLSKTGSSLADLTTRSAADLSSGNLAYARMPSGSGTWTAVPTISGTVTVGADVLVSTGYFSNIGALTKKFLTLHCAELWVETLVAQNTIATIGGRVLVGPTNILTVDAGTGATSLTFKYNNFANGDRIYFEANGSVEWMAVTSSASGSAGAYVYTVTRNLDGSGANAWTAGDAAFNTGTTGKGFIDLYSTSGVLSGSGPTIVGNVRTGTTYSNIATRWAIGNLNGVYGYVAETYGAAFGDPSAAWIKIDTTNGVRIGYNTTTKIALNASGSASFSEGSVSIDSTGIAVTPNFTNTWLDSAAYRFPFTSGVLGLVGYDDGAALEQGLLMHAKWTGGGAATHHPTIELVASSNSSGFSYADSIVLGYNPTFGAGVYITGEVVQVELSPFKVRGADLSVLNSAAVAKFTVDDATGDVTSSGVLTLSGFGTHTLSAGGSGGNHLKVRNSTAGTGNYAMVQIHNDSDTGLALYTTSTTYTASGHELQDAGVIRSTRVGGISIASTDGSGEIRFYTGGTSLRTKIDANGDYIPVTDGTLHVGVPAKRFAYMTALAFNLTDMSLDNGWSLTEAERIGIAEPGVALVDDAGLLIAFFGKDRFYTKQSGNVDALKYTVTTLDQRIHMDRTPEIRVKGHNAAGQPIYKTAADVPPMPDVTKGKTNAERKGPPQ